MFCDIAQSKRRQEEVESGLATKAWMLKMKEKEFVVNINLLELSESDEGKNAKKK